MRERTLRINKTVLPLFSSGICVLLAGCAALTLVEPPTAEELEAAQSWKKTLAVMGFVDGARASAGIGAAAQGNLEPFLQMRFNLVGKERAAEADYLLYGEAFSDDFSRPQSDTYERDGKQLKRSWVENEERVVLQIRVTDSAGEKILYDGKVTGEEKFKTDEEDDGDNESNLMQAVDSALSIFSTKRLDAIESALRNASPRAIAALKSHFPQEGKVLKIISPNEAVVGFGQATGVYFGDRVKLDASSSKASLRVTRVAVLTSVVKGPAKIVSALQVGDLLYAID